ncbi:MAG TPA: hypothetical protein VN678_06880 [Acidobacteriaceae bacterium]|nr:hypothetical protein [Acidobacteriaceae bacterium]
MQNACWSLSAAVGYGGSLGIHAAHASLFAAGVAFIQAPQLAARIKDHEHWLAFLAIPTVIPLH